MEGVTRAVWVGMQFLEHASKNNQRLEIKPRQRSTAQGIASSVRHPAKSTSSITEPQNGRGWQGPLWVTQPNPLPKQGLAHGRLPVQRRATSPKGQLQEPGHLCPPGSAVPARTQQNSPWVSDLSDSNGTTNP